MHLVHAARDDTTTMMFQETRVLLFEQNLHKSTGRAANQAIRESRDRGQQLRTAQEFFNIRNDPHAILLQAKEALYQQAIYQIRDHHLSLHQRKRQRNKYKMQRKQKKSGLIKIKKPSEDVIRRTN